LIFIIVCRSFVRVYFSNIYIIYKKIFFVLLLSVAVLSEFISQISILFIKNTVADGVTVGDQS
jgi:hypothetical protein